MLKQFKFQGFKVFNLFLRVFKSNSFRVSFVSCLIGSILIHFYFLANNFVNHDSIIIISNNFDWLLTQGKWFATPLASLEGPFVVNYISQLIGIVAISISAGIISETFYIKSKLWSVIIGIIMCSFPSVATCLMYLMLDYFGITLLLAVLAGYLLINGGGYKLFIRNNIIDHISGELSSLCWIYCKHASIRFLNKLYKK